jgi:hypothetical protein
MCNESMAFIAGADGVPPPAPVPAARPPSRSAADEPSAVVVD